MSNRSPQNRRKFLKKSMLGVASVMASKAVSSPLQASPLSSSSRKIINPAIDNCRVVCCIDPEMVTGNPMRWNTIADQNEFIAVDRIQKNMDQMAMSLAQKNSAEEAWATIFQKPDLKEWAEVKVAVKVNAKTRSGIPKNNPRLAVIDKICKAVNNLGVPFENIIIFDADDEEASILYKEYVGNGLPENVIVSKRYDALGGRMDTPVPAPWNRDAPCVHDIVNGTIDILVNCSVNKGSHNWTGPATITMKNHYGTFLVELDASYHHFDFLVALNKSDAIVGGSPPRQQLCIVDSIYACTTGPSEPPNKAPHALIMGTCSPVVDYLTIKKIREGLMGAKHTESIVNRYLTEFGYTPNDVADFIYVEPVSTSLKNTNIVTASKETLRITLHHLSRNLSDLTFRLYNGIRPLFIDIHDVQGRQLKSLRFSTVKHGELSAVWDGCNSAGQRLHPGTYIVSVRQNGTVQSRSFTITQ